MARHILSMFLTIDLSPMQPQLLIMSLPLSLGAYREWDMETADARERREYPSAQRSSIDTQGRLS